MLVKPEIHQAKILVVDDQIANVTLLEKILANIGYQQVFSTLDPTAVCELHRQHQFDLILLDLQMPVMDGFAVMQELKEVEPQSYTPVLVITAQPAEKLRALQAGAKDFVSKPFELVELQTRIANMLEVRLLYKRLAEYNLILEKRVEERTVQLRQSEARFKSFTKLSSDWYWEQDANGNYISAEGPVFEMLGIRSISDDGLASETLENSSREPEDANFDANLDASDDVNDDAWNQAEYAQLHEKIQSRTPFLNYVYRRILNDGSHQFLQVSGEPIFDDVGRFTGYRGIGMELNDRRRANIESTYLRMALNSVGLAIMVFDGESKNLLDANLSACNLFGIAHQDLANFDLHHWGLSDLHTRNEEFANLVVTTGMLRENSQLRIQAGEYSPIGIEWRAFACDTERNSISDKWVIVAIMSETETITVFDGLD